ncbi:transcriptional coactivator YAP1-like isoform 2-T2 [Pholidichthys leucotaenia]
MDAHRGAPPAGQQVVHVLGDSKTELEALFSSVMNPGKAARKQPQSVPMRMRKLPESFFRQPEPRGHSRQASSDGGVCGSLAPHHVRAHSSPASLPINSLSTQAADAAAAPVIPDEVPLPQGWEMARTPSGQRYFLNHLDKTTTWTDPRLTLLHPAATQHPIIGPPVHGHSLSNPVPTTQTHTGNPETGQKQRQEKERLKCKQGIPQQVTLQEAGGRSQKAVGMDHDRSGQTLVPSLDVRIRSSNHEPTLNGSHSRNQSTDSGLSVGSLPHTSDHMLSPVDHMDTGDSGEPPSMSLQESMPVLSMSEGEELMPCIPEGLSSDLLMDMETVFSGSHMDRDSLLTWL